MLEITCVEILRLKIITGNHTSNQVSLDASTCSQNSIHSHPLRDLALLIMSCFSCIFFFFLLTLLKIYLRFLAYLSLLYLVKLKEKCHATLPFNVILSLSPSHRQASWKSYPHSLLSFLTTSSSSTMASQQRLIWGWQWSSCCCIKWLPLHSHWTWHLTSLGFWLLLLPVVGFSVSLWRLNSSVTFFFS